MSAPLPELSSTTRTELLCRRILECAGSAVSAYKTGDDIVLPRGRVQSVRLLLRGAVKIVKEENGSGNTLSVRSTGALLGFYAATTRGEAGTTAIAISSCEIVLIQSEQLEGLLKLPTFAAAVTELLAHESEDGLICSYAFRSGPARKRLDRLFGYFVRTGIGDAARPLRGVRLHYSDLAELIGITPEHLSRMLRRLEQRGILTKCAGGSLFELSRQFR